MRIESADSSFFDNRSFSFSETTKEKSSPELTSAPLLSREMEEVQTQCRTLGLKPWMISFMRQMPLLPHDTASNARPDQAVTTHLVWDVEPDFDNKQLKATATYSYMNKRSDNGVLIFDVSKLSIESVKVNGEAAEYRLIPSSDSHRYDALEIAIPKKVGKGEVSIQYKTSQEASGIFWVDKEFTEGKKYPLVYTIFQEIEGASAIPGQHTPQVRLTYEVNAKTHHPDLIALSSVTNNPKQRNETGEYSGLRMPRAVPLYLLSLQVGNLSFRPYEADARTGVYAEDVMLDTVHKGFDKLPEFMKAAEEICGPYSWGVYRPILLSWAFPWGAMEHPCASTCGAICLERPNVIPHELAHSWAGNDTTNCNWQQFFWNEGLTTFVEYLICERVWGTDYASMEFLYLLSEVKQVMEELRPINPDFLRLCQEGSETRVSAIPYGKGALFFFMLRDAIGKEDFSKFLKDYMTVFFRNTMSEERFLSFLQLWLKNEKGISDFEQFKVDHKIDQWLHGLDIPANAPRFHSHLLDQLVMEKDRVLRGETIDVEKIQKWDLSMQVAFLSLIGDVATREQFAAMDAQLHFTQSKAMSVLGDCSEICSRIGYLTPEIKEMIIYYMIKRNSRFDADRISSHLSKTDEGRALIQTILDRDQGRLFPITRLQLEKNLKIENK